MFVRDGRDENREMLSKLLGIFPLHPNCQKNVAKRQTIRKVMEGNGGKTKNKKK